MDCPKCAVRQTTIDRLLGTVDRLRRERDEAIEKAERLLKALNERTKYDEVEPPLMGA